MNASSSSSVRSWLDRLLEFAITMVAVGLLLNWAWQLIRPLIPVLAVSSGIGILVMFIVRRQRNW